MDEDRYGELLKNIRPRIIETAEEHERLLTLAEELMERGDSLGEEEREALSLIVLLVEAFESSIEDEGGEPEEPDALPPHEMLAQLMRTKEVAIEDIVPLFGNPRLTRDVLDGKRPITRGQAKELGQYFRVPAKLFLG